MNCTICGDAVHYVLGGEDAETVSQLQFYEHVCEPHARNMIQTHDQQATLTILADVRLLIMESVEPRALCVELERSLISG